MVSLAATLAAGGALPSEHFEQELQLVCAALSTGACGVSGKRACQSQPSDEGEDGARFDHCFRLSILCGVFCFEQEVFQLHK